MRLALQTPKPIAGRDFDSAFNANGLATFRTPSPQPTAQLGLQRQTIQRKDRVPPTAKLTIANVTAAGTNHTFTVTYVDRYGIQRSTINSRDIQVIGTGGSQFALLTSVRLNRKRTRAIATYRIVAPGGSWEESDNGIYTLSLRRRQVSDIHRNFITPRKLGQFQVNLAGVGSPPTTNPPAPNPPGNPLPIPPTNPPTTDPPTTLTNPLRIEAEDMTLSGYSVEVKDFASGGELVRVASGSPSGSAEFTFTGSSGAYRVAIGYFDENDGASQITVRVGGTVVENWTLNQSLSSNTFAPETFVVRTVAAPVTLNAGTTIRLEGTLNAGEPSRIDYLELIPTSYTVPVQGTLGNDGLNGDSQNNVINGFLGDDSLNGGEGNDILTGGNGKDTLNGGNGSDTASYLQSASGMVIDLQVGTAVRMPKIMPLGDSITYGVMESVTPLTETGGYRLWLENTLIQANQFVDFVGSQANGPTSMGDRDHEGNRGKTIDWLNDRMNTFLTGSQPDVVLLMIGTNDSGSDSVSTMISQLGSLIDKITTFSPNIRLLVSTIPPIRSDAGQPTQRITTAQGFNAALPSLISNKQSQGKAVELVDMVGVTGAVANALTENDISPPTVDNGLHPTQAGFQKIASFWYNALTSNPNTFNLDRDTLTSIENAIGTAFSDRITGNAGANSLTGGRGSDRLTGGGGVDQFVYQTPNEGGDTITDFGTDDILQISAAGFGGGLVAGTGLATSAATTGSFVSSSNPTPSGTGANFLYNTTTGALSFDRDGTGTGAAIAIATLTGNPALNASQFVIF